MDGWIVFSRLSSDTTSSVKSTRHSRDSSLCSVTLSSGGFPGGLAGEESTCNAGDLGLIPGLGRYPGEGKEYPLWPGEFHGLYSP